MRNKLTKHIREANLQPNLETQIKKLRKQSDLGTNLQLN